MKIPSWRLIYQLTYEKKHNPLNTRSKEITARKDKQRTEQVGKSLSGAHHIRWKVCVSGVDVGGKADKGLLVHPEGGVMGNGVDT